MNQKQELIGKIFGKLTVIEFSHRDNRGRKYWFCQCDCGNKIITRELSLKTGHTRSCGKNYFYTEKDYMVGINHDGAKFFFDIEDYERIKQHTWGLRTGYFAATINKKHVKLHRFILNLKYNESADHIDCNTANNRRQNLRKCTDQQNHFNRSKNRGTSIYKGVCWIKKKNKWRSSIGYNGRTIYLGEYKNEIDAAKAYNKKAIELFGEFARINIIGGNKHETTSVLS